MICTEKEKDFKEEELKENMATQAQLKALAKARARKKQLDYLRKMREAKNRKAKRALDRLRR